MMNCLKLLFDAFKVHYRAFIIVVAPFAWTPIFIYDNTVQSRCLYVMALMCTFWVSECLPLPITALVPVFLCPLMGIMDSPKVCAAFLKEANMLFFGTLIIAVAAEDSKLHNRIALGVITVIGCNPRQLCLGLALCATFISLFISNTATVAMMIPIIEACLEEYEAQGVCLVYHNKTMVNKYGEIVPTPVEKLKPTKITMCYYLTCTYCASIGGIGIITSTGTNLAVKGVYESYFPNGPGITFASWSLLNLPIMVISVICTYIWLQIYFMGLLRPNSEDAQVLKAGDWDAFMITLKNKQSHLGPWSFREACVGLLFVVAVTLWFFREPKFVRGWPELITEHKMNDGAIAMVIAIALFTIPAKPNFIYMFSTNSSKRPKKESPPLVTWITVQTHMQWGVIVLMGGAFALADCVIESGTGKTMAGKLDFLIPFPQLYIQMITGAMTLVITELSANVVIANVLTPVFAELSIRAKVHPIYLCIPVGVFSSFSFCLPVSTPPNSMIKAAASIPTFYMAMGGIGVKIITFIIFISMFNLYGSFIFGDLGVLPDWATAKVNESSKYYNSSHGFYEVY